SQAAADKHVVTGNVTRLDDGKLSKVVGMNICTIVFGEAEGRLELARKVGLAVDRLDRVVCRRGDLRGSRGRERVDLLAVEPDFPVAGGSWGGMGSPKMGVMLEFISERILNWRRAAKHVALDVAAGGKRRQESLVDPPDGFGEVLFQDPVKLELLS